MKNKTKVVALLPMKGNSERIPNKNLKIFSGKPLYHHILTELLQSKFIDEVIINTDSAKIAENVNCHFSNQNIRIVKRLPSICGDYVSMNKIIEQDINNSDGDIYIQTHSTNPNLRQETIDEALDFFMGCSKYDSVFSVNRLQSRFYNSDGKAMNHNPSNLLRTQDLDPIFEENSNFYVFTRESFHNAGNRRIGLNPYLFEIGKLESMDIDNLENFIIAEAVFNHIYT